MLITHYWQLLKHYRKLIFWIVGSTTLFTAVLCTFLLFVMPMYTASASVVMLPTDAELSFAQGWTTGPQSSEVLTETHIEFLKSRGVAETVLDAVAGFMPDREAEPKGLSARLQKMAIETVGFFRRTYRVLNSGTYVEPTARERALSGLMRGTEVTPLPGSFILKISVSLRSAEAAALAANTLADAYVARSSELLEIETARLRSYVADQIANRERSLDGLVLQERQFSQEQGLVSLDEERRFLEEARRSEREASSNATVELQAMQAELAALRAQRSTVRQSEVLQGIDREIALSEGALASARSRQQARQQNIVELEAALRALDQKEQPLKSLQTQINAFEKDVESLSLQLLSLNLVSARALDRIRVIDPAIVPVYASFPEVFDFTVVAFIASMLIALFAAIALDTLSDTIKTRLDLERVEGAKVLNTLPAALSSTGGRKARLRIRTPQAKLREHRLRRELGGEFAQLGRASGDRLAIGGAAAPEDLAQAGLLVAELVAALGSTVLCDVKSAEGTQLYQISREKEVAEIAPGEGADSELQISVHAERLDFSNVMTSASATSGAFLFVVAPGRVSAQDLESTIASVSAPDRLHFVLFES